ncbi:MAG: type II secretion system F family protein [Candidatus Hydrothermales bacterium]
MILLIFILSFIAVYFLVLSFIPSPEEVALSSRLERLRRRRVRIEFASKIIAFFAPTAEILVKLLKRYLPEDYLKALEMKMEMAGERGKPVEAVLMEKLISGIVFFFFSMVLVSIIFNPPFSFTFVLSIVIFFIGFFYKDFSLNQEIRKRHYLIQKDLGDALDQLNTAVQAGLGFNAAFQYVTEAMHPCPLKEEFALMLSELRLGKKRTEALRALADRTQHPDLTLVAITIAHGEELGAPITQTLASLADEVRRKRWDQAEERAAKTPVYIVIPTILLILPTIFIIIFGPFVLYYLYGGM